MQEHAQAYAAHRKTTTSYRLYRSAAWKRLRVEVLADAQRCATPKCVQPPTVVDHVRPHRGDQELFFDRSNLQPMCKRCHDRKTAKFDGGFGRVPNHRGEIAGTDEPTLA